MAVIGNKSDGVANFSASVRANKSNWTNIGALQAIAPGGPTSLYSDGGFGRHMALGISKSTTFGNPGTPSLAIAQPGFWRFRWSVVAGSHSISVNMLQASNMTPRPTLVVKKNAFIGLAADITLTAPSGTGWVTAGPATISVTSNGVIWVELWNNLYAQYDTAYFDHVVTT